MKYLTFVVGLKTESIPLSCISELRKDLFSHSPNFEFVLGCRLEKQFPTDVILLAAVVPLDQSLKNPSQSLEESQNNPSAACDR